MAVGWIRQAENEGYHAEIRAVVADDAPLLSEAPIANVRVWRTESEHQDIDLYAHSTIGDDWEVTTHEI